MIQQVIVEPYYKLIKNVNIFLCFFFFILDKFSQALTLEIPTIIMRGT